jgi:hypothetical protein
MGRRQIENPRGQGRIRSRWPPLRYGRWAMNEEHIPNIPVTGVQENEIQALEARRLHLLQRKDLVRDSYIKKHIDALLLEVEDLIMKYDQSIPGSVKKEG